MNALTQDGAIELELDAEPAADALEDDDFEQEQDATAPGAKQSTLEFLLMRMRHKSNFPALSHTISTINKLTGSDHHSVHALSDALLKDFALVNRLLRLVNSSTYGQFRGTISTISRAVMILGFDVIRSLAITLILFEHLQNKAQAVELKDEVLATFFAGVVAKRMAGTAGVRDPEEAFICGVFHRLGHLLATFYLYDESVEIDKRVRQGMSEQAASSAVLGISYDDLGAGVARAWHLPAGIVKSMERVGADAVRKPASPADRLRLTANFADAMCEIATTAPVPQHERLMDAVLGRYRAGIPWGKKQFTGAFDEAVAEFLEESAHLLGPAQDSRLLQCLRQLGNGRPRTDGAEASEDTLERAIQDTVSLGAQDLAPETQSAEATLTAGIQDITNTLVDNYDLNGVLRIILETMYRAMGFARVILFTRDAQKSALRARLALGAGTDTLIRSLLLPLGKTQDVFQVALDKNVDLFIADSNAENISGRVPAWFRQSIGAETFLLLPIVIDKRIVGLLYADKDKAGELIIKPKELNLLKTLRNQAVLTIRQKV